MPWIRREATLGTPINREIDKNELSVLLDNSAPLPLQDVLSFYRSIEAHLRKPHLFGPAFALELYEYKVGSSEGRFRGFWRPGKRKGQLARQLELEERQTIAAERQASAAERSANAAERAADAAEDTAESARSTRTGTWTMVGVTVLVAAASVISDAIEQGDIATPTHPSSGTTLAETVTVSTVEGPICVVPPHAEIVQQRREASHRAQPIPDERASEVRAKRLRELEWIRQADNSAERRSVVARPLHRDGVVITRLGNVIPMVGEDLLELREGRNYYLYLIPIQDNGQVLWAVKEVRVLDDF